ncbi:MAG: iron-containing alcohol dehydrogenase [Chloroflexi bacterium]|nr:iron-containing alcohol dehydrogenase [Chloroflexota bacterium]
MAFEFATATRIIFGEGKLKEIAAIAPEFGSRALVVCGSVERAKPLFDLLDSAKIEVSTFSVSGEPSIPSVKAGTEQAKAFDAHMVIAFGGGSAIDAGKAIAALATNPGEPLDYLEVIGKGQKLANPPLPFVAIPTTAGTGSEVTRNAVIASPEHKVKVSLRSPLMLPRVALVDPELTYGLPKEITAYTGMDALTQCIEPFVSSAANPLTDAISAKGIRLAINSLTDAYHEGEDSEARHDMALASLFGGLALANAKLGGVHGFAGVIGGMYDAPHGAICASLLPFVMEINVRALKLREPNNPALQRYSEILFVAGGADYGEPPEYAVDTISSIVGALGIPPLGTYGIKSEAFPTIVEKAAHSSSMKGNPIVLTADELTEILEKAL